MDITDTLAPNSDQLDAVDLLGGPRTFTVESVSRGSAEQPVQVHLAEFPRVWRPSKGMRRVLAACWGTDSSQWPGRRVRLYCDPEVIFGKEKIGGTRIAALSHIDGPKKVPLLVSRGKSAIFTVEPLTEPPPRAATAPPSEPTAEEIAAETDLYRLGGMWRSSGPEVRELIHARATELKAAHEPAPEAISDDEFKLLAGQDEEGHRG